MKIKCRLYFAITTFLLLILISMNASADTAQGTETQISNYPSGKYSPTIYGDRILWSDTRNATGVYFDIYMYNLSTSTETKITTSGSAHNPSIYEDRIVWIDKRNRNNDIYMYNLSTSTETQITADGSAVSLAIYGDMIVWDEFRNICMYNLSNSKKTWITTSGSAESPAIYDNRIVWKDTRDGNDSIYMYNFSTSTETKIPTSESNHYYPAIYGDRIVWTTGSNAPAYIDARYDIYMYNLSTATKTQITSNGSVNQHIGPAIHGDKLVWTDNRNGWGGNYDIYMYDLSTHKETQVTVNQSDDYEPAIYGNTIVWISFRNAGYNIYMFTLAELIHPIANFNTNVTSGYAPLTIKFSDTSKGFPTSWNWDFNDGSSSTDQNPLHTYFKSGTYTVNLTAINVNGTDSKLATIYVLVKPSPVLPVADFSSNTTEGYAPLSVQFNDSSKNATSVSWDFENDGKIDSTDRNPMHNYSSVGTYTVSLTAKNPNGTDSSSGTITVLVKPELVLPVANFSSNVSEGYAPLSVQFNDNSKNATSLYWNFGDGNNSIEPNPLHTYFSVGTYTVNLTASNVNGTNSSFGTITVSAKPEPVLPIANFRTSVAGGYAPLSVTFTDCSLNTTSISWDVNSDGKEDSNASSFTYEYTSEGTYTAKLIVKNENGTSEKTATIIVDKKSSGGSSGGSGGGGGGGSPEPAKNVEVKELSQVFITNGNHAKFNFPKNVTAVVYLSFDARKTAGKTTTIVEMLKNQSTLTPDSPQGEVYSYLNIWVGNGGYATEKNIKNAVICFKVEKSWIQEKDINQSSILLNRYSDKKWNELPTTFLNEDDKYVYFTAQTPGFSPFAIAGKKTVKGTSAEIQPESNIEDTIENNVNTASGIEQDVDPKESASTPGFEIIFGITCMFGAFLYRRG